MRALVTLMMVAAGTLAASAANAQEGTGGATPGQSPDVTVRGPERMVCRNVTRTATRMRSNRVCRPVSQWRDAGQQSEEDQIAEAADRLDALGADDISTNCVGYDLDTLTPPSGPRGPR